jgi:sugar phosphate isomerase/epimerase
LGPSIASCHAKDLKWIVEMNVHFLEVVPGRGQIDYRSYLNGVASLSMQVPLMLEHLKTPEEYEEGKQYIKRVGASIGIDFA